MKCIFCGNPENLKTIEHIVPESLGNKKYVLDSAKICGTCNNRFSKFEDKAISKTILGLERARLGVFTKKDKPSKGLVRGMEWTANISGERNLVTGKGINPDNIKPIDENKFEVRVPMYDKDTNVATSKLLLKIGLESIINSKPDIADKYVLSKAKKFLKGEASFNWPYAIPKTYVSSKFKDFVNHEIDAHLRSFECRISYREIKGSLLFRFKYGCFTSLICLNSTDTDWIKYLKNEQKSKFTICPKYFRELTNV